MLGWKRTSRRTTDDAHVSATSVVPLSARMTVVVVAAILHAGSASSASAEWVARRAEPILKLCDSKDPQMRWMLVGYVTGVMDKAFMDDVIADAFTTRANAPPQLTKTLRAQIIGYCPPTMISPENVRDALCAYRKNRPRTDLHLAAEWIQDALKQAYPCTQ